MALDYRKCAEEIAANIGGGANVISAAHCATRLRLVIADNGKVNKAVLENIDGVKGMFESNGQLQLIIGTGTVNKVYDEFLAVTGVSAASKDDVKAAAVSKMPWWKKILKTPGDIFVPILPAIVASGLMMGIVEAIPKFWPAFEKTGWFSFLDLVANTAFALLPVLVAASASRVFKGNLFLGIVVGLMLVHPALLNAWNSGSVKDVSLTFNKPIPIEWVDDAIEKGLSADEQDKLNTWLLEGVVPSETAAEDADTGAEAATAEPAAETAVAADAEAAEPAAETAAVTDEAVPKSPYLQRVVALYGTSEGYEGKQGISPSLLNNFPTVKVKNDEGKEKDSNLSDKVWEYIKKDEKKTVEEIGGIDQWNLFGSIGIKRVGYQGHVIPVILAVLFMCFIEKRLHKIVPEMIDLFVTPLVTVLVTAFASFLIIGPIFAVVENWVLAGAKWLITVGYGVGAAAMGALYPWTVVMGLHHMYNVIEAGMLAGTGGVNTWMPIASAANFAQFGACLAVALKVKNQKTKSVAFPSSLSASLGITEPAIFGINFRFMKPFICGMIGGAVGAWFAAVIPKGTEGQAFGATTYGVTGIPGIPAINNIPMYIIELLIASGVAFALTWMIWKEEQQPAVETAPAGAFPAPEASPAETVEVPTVSVIRCAAGTVLQPVKGTVIARDQIPDDTFASGVLGDGVGIQPDDNKVVAPFDGTISSVADSQHAVGIEANGMEMLIHVGVDTVNMKGDGFKCLVKEGDEVKAGQTLITFDREKIKAAGYSDTVAVLLTNSDDLEGVECGAK